MKYPGCAPDYDYFCVAMSSIFGNLFLIIIIGVPVLVGLFIWKWIKKESELDRILPWEWFNPKKKQEVKVPSKTKKVEVEEEEKEGFFEYMFYICIWGGILYYFFDINIFALVFKLLSAIFGE